VTPSVVVLAVIGQAWALGGAQNIAVQLVTRGSMGPVSRTTSVMNPKDRTVAGMRPVNP
jgi:hypothetical protein